MHLGRLRFGVWRRSQETRRGVPANASTARSRRCLLLVPERDRLWALDSVGVNNDGPVSMKLGLQGNCQDLFLLLGVRHLAQML
jgi:hypothetical protein